jgi:hypothetical protein
MRLVFPLSPSTIPVDPGAPDAKQWLQDELAKPMYQAARPTWFDLASEAVRDWFTSLFSASGDGVNGLLAVILVLILLAVIVAAFFIFGRPRLNRRGARIGDILGDGDTRDAAALRRSAEAAAAAARWDQAIAEIFRALAKGLSERTVLSVTPGTTAHDFGTRAAQAFPDQRGRLMSAATIFDRVRYLGKAGSPNEYRELADLELILRTARPAALESVTESAARL